MSRVNLLLYKQQVFFLLAIPKDTHSVTEFILHWKDLDYAPKITTLLAVGLQCVFTIAY